MTRDKLFSSNVADSDSPYKPLKVVPKDSPLTPWKPKPREDGLEPANIVPKDSPLVPYKAVSTEAEPLVSTELLSKIGVPALDTKMSKSSVPYTWLCPDWYTAYGYRRGATSTDYTYIDIDFGTNNSAAEFSFYIGNHTTRQLRNPVTVLATPGKQRLDFPNCRNATDNSRNLWDYTHRIMSQMLLTTFPFIRVHISNVIK